MEEIKKMLMQVIQGQEAMKIDINGLKEGQEAMKIDINGLKEGQEELKINLNGIENKISSIENKISSIENETFGLKEGQETMKIDVRKNTISLESIETKLDTISEVQTAHKEQSDRAYRNTDALVSENFDLIETALKKATREINEVNESLDFVKHKETKNEEELYKIQKHLTIIK